MTWLETILIAIVEGLTEFLPVSSTGHMIITQSLLGMHSSEFLKAFTVIIQFGAILSVVVLYWKRFFQSFSFYFKLFVACVPAGILGVLFNDYIDDVLESVIMVACMLLIGGIIMLFVDKWFDKNTKEDQEVTYKNAFIVGAFQCLAMLLPGISRSMATIVGGMSRGLSRKQAAEFSFFLAVPTMAGATMVQLIKLLKTPTGIETLQNNMSILIVGNIVAFIVALLAIKFFIGFVTKYGFKMFGWYRIIVGSIILIALACGCNLSL